MEDAHTTLLTLGPPASDDNPSEKVHPERLSFFGVFDGHGGDKVALFTGENIANIIFKQDTFMSGDYAQGLKDGFLATDRAILNGTCGSKHQRQRAPHWLQSSHLLLVMSWISPRLIVCWS